MKKQTVNIDIGDIIKNKKNPKKHSDEQIENSIKEFGYIENIIIDENNTILAGHGRYDALKKLGHKSIEVIRVTGLTEKQKEKYLLLSNKLVELGGWDFELLKEFDIDILKKVHFSNSEIKFLHDDFEIPIKNIELEHMYQIVIECDNEIEQEKTYNKLKDKYKCQVLTL